LGFSKKEREMAKNLKVGHCTFSDSQPQEREEENSRLDRK